MSDDTGKDDSVKGKVTEAVGWLTGDREAEAKGKAERLSGGEEVTDEDVEAVERGPAPGLRGVRPRRRRRARGRRRHPRRLGRPHGLRSRPPHRRRRRASRRRRRRRAGPAAPSPPGTIRVPRLRSMRAAAVELGLGGGEEDVAEAERHRAGHARPAGGRAGWPPTPPPGRPACRSAPGPRAGPPPGRAGDRPRSRCPTPRPRGSRGPRTRRAGRRARRSRGRCGRRCRRAPSSSRPSSTMPPPTPVDTTMARKSRTPAGGARPTPRPGPAPWRRCRRRPAAR